MCIIISFSHAYHTCSNYNHTICEFDQVFKTSAKQGSYEKSKLLAMYSYIATNQYQHGHVCIYPVWKNGLAKYQSLDKNQSDQYIQLVYMNCI